MSKRVDERVGGLTRGQRIDRIIGQLGRAENPLTVAMIATGQKLKNTPYIVDILKQLIRDGVVTAELRQGNGYKFNVYTLTDWGLSIAGEVFRLEQEND